MIRTTIYSFILIALFNNANAQVTGCTDPLANNYNTAATINNGSCTYNTTTINVSQIAPLTDTLKETSGLIFWNGYLWSHNDDTDPYLYALDTATGAIMHKVLVSNAINRDWEEITQNKDYIFIGDFGNNVNGNRTDLTIYRIAKSAIVSFPLTVTADSIRFTYADQTNFTPTGNNNTDFDCEAFVATDDSLFLFTKEWVSKKTRLYALSASTGTKIANNRSEFQINGLVTGATFLPSKKTVVLTGYQIQSVLLQPFVSLLYDFTGSDFFSGNKRTININAPYHQIEAISTINALDFYISNEYFSQSVVTVPAKLQKITLGTYLNQYYQSLGVNMVGKQNRNINIYPNPVVGNVLNIEMSGSLSNKYSLSITNLTGRVVLQKSIMPIAGRAELSLPENLQKGLYFLQLKNIDGECNTARIEVH